MFISDIDDLNGGFKIDYSQAADSHKKLKAAFICVDFPNKKAENSIHSDCEYYYDLLAVDGLRVFKEISYGKLDLEIVLFNEWFTMLRNDEDYHMAREISFEIHKDYIQDAMDISCHTVDYSLFDILYIIPVHGSDVPFSPTMVDKKRMIKSKSGEIGLAVTFGADMYNRKGKLFAHENGHIMGLPDLYTYVVTQGARDGFSHCGTFDLMGCIEGLAPDFLAYSKWRLGWIENQQVINVTKSGEYTLTPLGLREGAKLACIAIDNYKGYAVEYRTPIGLDTALQEEGVIVYRIDGKIASGMGCITIIPKEKEKYLSISTKNTDGLLRKSDKVEIDGISIEYLGNGKIYIKI